MYPHVPCRRSHMHSMLLLTLMLWGIGFISHFIITQQEPSSMLVKMISINHTLSVYLDNYAHPITALLIWSGQSMQTHSKQAAECYRPAFLH